MNIIKYIFRTTFGYNYKDNALDFLRLVLSGVVIYFHTAMASIGYKETPNIYGSANYGMLAVFCFFLISGMLITRSWVYTDNIYAFLKKRFLRIYPAYWLCLVVISVFFIPVWYFQKLSPNINYYDMFKDSFRYLIKNIGGEVMYVRTESVNVGEVNASLWSIIMELRAYVIVVILGSLGILRRKWVIALIALVSLVFYGYTIGYGPFANFVAQFSGTNLFVVPFIFFLVGVFVFVFDKYIPWNFPLFVICGVTLYIQLQTNTLFYGAPLFLSYCFLYISQNLVFKNFINRFGKNYGDYSFGMYLYGWPCQTLLLNYDVYKNYGYLAFFGGTLVLSFAFSFVSWHLVEKKFLKKAIVQTN
jgi:peptidoglycan/LPS O-acetylase OafA/YrhL